MTMTKAFEAIRSAALALPAAIQQRSGSVFYSGTGAFTHPSRLYTLGLNPGGSPVQQAQNTVRSDLEDWSARPEHYSRYVDESWEGKAPGTHGMQPRIRHMFGQLGLDLRSTPASNLVFIRSRGEADLAAEKASLLRDCWPVHQAVIDGLGIDTILCLGGTAGNWVRERLGITKILDRYSETNARGWTSETHIGDCGRAVVTVTHPGRANWINPDSDPTPLLQRALSR